MVITSDEPLDGVKVGRYHFPADGRKVTVTAELGEHTKQLVVTAFDVAEDGSLSNRRVWAQLERILPDGICLDAEGAIWVTSPVSHAVFRIELEIESRGIGDAAKRVVGERDDGSVGI